MKLIIIKCTEQRYNFTCCIWVWNLVCPSKDKT
jgi:hypothetical protein